MNFLGFLGLVVLVLVAIFLCVKFIPGANDVAQELIDRTQTEQTEESGATEENSEKIKLIY